MKKLTLFFLLLFLTGCSNTMNNIPDPVTIESVTGIVMRDKDSKAPHEISYTISEDDELSWWKLSVVSGYAYSAIYKDLWIIISLNDPYTEMFFTLPDEPVFVRTGNKLYNSTMSNGKIYTTDTPSFFVEMFNKETGESLINIINNTHLSSWCIVTSVTKKNILFSQRSGKDENNFFEITSPDGIMWDGSQCLPDNENPDTPFGIYYLQSLYHQDRYYKISYPAACAPSCWMFSYVEFFYTQPAKNQ